MTCYKFDSSHWLKLQHSDWRVYWGRAVTKHTIQWVLSAASCRFQPKTLGCVWAQPFGRPRVYGMNHFKKFCAIEEVQICIPLRLHKYLWLCCGQKQFYFSRLRPFRLKKSYICATMYSCLPGPKYSKFQINLTMFNC